MTITKLRLTLTLDKVQIDKAEKIVEKSKGKYTSISHYTNQALRLLNDLEREEQSK